MSDTESNNEKDPTSEPAAEESSVVESPDSATPEGDKETKQWAMFIHFSLLAGLIVPLAGLIVPILLWQIKKDDLPGIVPHVHVVFNWIITSLVYSAICFVLIFIFIGFLGFIALGLATIIFSVMGGLKANEGEVWEYPGTFIRVFK